MVKDREWDKYRNNNLGFVFQSFNLLNHLTVLDNIMLKLETLNLYSKDERYKLSVEAKKRGKKKKTKRANRGKKQNKSK